MFSSKESSLKSAIFHRKSAFFGVEIGDFLSGIALFRLSCPYDPVKQQLQSCPHYDVNDQYPGDIGAMFQQRVQYDERHGQAENQGHDPPWGQAGTAQDFSFFLIRLSVKSVLIGSFYEYYYKRIMQTAISSAMIHIFCSIEIIRAKDNRVLPYL